MFPTAILPRPLIDVEHHIRNFQQTLSWRNEENQYTLNLLAPGLDPNQIDVHVDKGRLVVAIQKGDTFSKTVQMSLPEDIEEDNISAQLSKGILTVVAPKSPQKQPKRITIQAND